MSTKIKITVIEHRDGTEFQMVCPFCSSIVSCLSYEKEKECSTCHRIYKFVVKETYAVLETKRL